MLHHPAARAGRDQRRPHLFQRTGRHRRKSRGDNQRGRRPFETDAAGRCDRRVLCDDDGIVEIDHPRLQVGDAGDRHPLRDHRRLAGVLRRQNSAWRLELEDVAAVGNLALGVDTSRDNATRLPEEERRGFEAELAVRHVPAELHRRLIEEDALTLLAESQDTGTEIDPGSGILDRAVRLEPDVGAAVERYVRGEEAAFASEPRDHVGEHQLRKLERHDMTARRRIPHAFHRRIPPSSESGRREGCGDGRRFGVDRQAEVRAGEPPLRAVAGVEHRNGRVDHGEPLEAPRDRRFELRLDPAVDLVERGKDFGKAAVGEAVGCVVGERCGFAELGSRRGGVTDVNSVG